MLLLEEQNSHKLLNTSAELRPGCQMASHRRRPTVRINYGAYSHSISSWIISPTTPDKLLRHIYVYCRALVLRPTTQFLRAVGSKECHVASSSICESKKQWINLGLYSKHIREKPGHKQSLLDTYVVRARQKFGWLGNLTVIRSSLWTRPGPGGWPNKPARFRTIYDSCLTVLVGSWLSLCRAYSTLLRNSFCSCCTVKSEVSKNIRHWEEVDEACALVFSYIMRQSIIEPEGEDQPNFSTWSFNFRWGVGVMGQVLNDLLTE
jgi:hypothetical protein